MWVRHFSLMIYLLNTLNGSNGNCKVILIFQNWKNLHSNLCTCMISSELSLVIFYLPILNTCVSLTVYIAAYININAFFIVWTHGAAVRQDDWIWLMQLSPGNAYIFFVLVSREVVCFKNWLNDARYLFPLLSLLFILFAKLLDLFQSLPRSE